MSDEKPLYEDDDFKVEISGPNEHILYIKERGEELQYFIPRSTLREFAQTSRGEFTNKIIAINPMLRDKIYDKGLTINDLHIVCCRSYIEQEARYMNKLELDS